MSNHESLFQRFLARLSNARFLTVSLLIHILLGTFLSGVVLFKVVREPEVFVASAAGTFVEPEEQGVPDEAPAPAEFEEPPSVAKPAFAQVATASAISAQLEAASPFETMAQPDIQTVGFGMTKALENTPAATKSSEAAGGTKLSSEMTAAFFGVPVTAGKVGLIGTFYDLKQNKDRKPTGTTKEEYSEIVSDFARNWSPHKLRKFFQAPTLLASTYLFTPDLDARTAPKAFGVEKDVQPSLWLAWYRGRVSPPKTGTFHFVGAGDDIMLVRFNGKIVLDRCWTRDETSRRFEAEANYDYGFSKIPNGFAKGPAVRVKAGELYEIDILIGERPGGRFFASLLIEDADVKYAKDARGNPILPVFRVDDEPVEEPRGMLLPPYQKEGPIWRAQAPVPLGGDS